MDKKDPIIVSEESMVEAILERLLEKIIPRVVNNPREEEWLTPEEAMKLLNIKSKSHFWSIKSQNFIEVSKMSRKIELIKKSSCIKYIEAHTKSF